MKSLLTITGLCMLLSSVNALAKNQECLSGPAILSLVPSASDETLTCLDSVMDGTATRAIILSSLIKNSQKSETFIVADFAVNPDSTTGAPILTHEIRIEDKALFPNGCGYYLKGARVLLKVNRFAAFYAHNQVRIIDFNDSTHLKISSVHDEHTPGSAYSCEGYTPNWNGSRENLKIDAATQTIILTSNSREWAEKIEQKKLTPLQMTFYERAFKEECTGKHSEVESKECLDLETAKNEGILNIRTLFHPEVVSTFAY